MAGVSSRTRSKNAPLNSGLPLDRSSSKRPKRVSTSTVNEPHYVFLGASDSSTKRTREVIHIGLSDDDDDSENVKEEALEDCEEKRAYAVDDVEERENSEEGEGSDVFVDKGENFGGSDDCGLRPEDPITIDSSDGDSDYCSSTDSDDNETSDEDFEIDDDRNGSSSSKDSGSSSSYIDEEEEEENNDWRTYRKVVEEMVRKVNMESTEFCIKSGETESKCEQEKEVENCPSSVNKNDECGVQDQEEFMHAEDASVSSSTHEVKGGFEVKGCFEMKGCSSNYKAEKQEAKRVKKEVRNVIAADDDDVQVIGDSKNCFGCSNLSEGEPQKDKKKKYNLRSQKRVQVMEETRDSTKVQKSERKHVNVDSHKGKEHHDDGSGFGVRNVSSLPNKDEYHKVESMPFKPKEFRLVELLAECYWGNKNSMKVDSNRLEEKDGGDVRQVDTRPPALEETLPLIWSLEKVEPLEKTKSEEELDELWEQMNISLKEEEIDSLIGNIGRTNEASQQNIGSPTSLCEHNFYLDEEIGVYCKLCGFVVTEIKNVSQPVLDRFPYEGSEKRVSFGGVNVSVFDESQFNVSGGDSDAVFSHNEGTVWDLIPGVKQSLYPHQQDGFEFIWKNLAGDIDLQKLKSADPCSEGGCIISHAPGTGKTRLTIVFLQTHLKLFPKCLPVIVAPASLLLTWEDEFKKWDIGVPFHNLNNLELSGNENVDVLRSVECSTNPQLDKEATRMVKLCSWFKEKSVLGISYNLYEKLAGGISQDGVKTRKKKGKKHASVQDNSKDGGVMGKVLREVPGVLVLDEGHTPRNQRSLIWKVLSEIQTRKRIILSGTPFQNNFVELYNTLTLVKPSFPDMIPPELKKFCQNRLLQEKKASKEWTWEPVSSGNTTGNRTDGKIAQLKSLMDSFVHVHKGSILQKNLPGLRDCVLALKPESLQKEILDSIEGSKNGLIFEHKLALVTVHPSLLLCCTNLTEKEESALDRDHLEKLRLNPYGGVKTRFLVEFVRLCDALHEKVLVFSQFIPPLCLIIEQLKSVFDWSEGKEVLCMHGNLDPKYKQLLIHTFNDAKSKVKILLASTKACSEGISLVGASRVVLLDVVWNPSVERQAISRAYRLGQKRVVYTYHLITQGTSEWTKYCKQAEKDRLSELVFSARDSESDKSRTCAANFEDKVLDKMIQHEKLKDMFGECVVQPKEHDLFGSFGS